MNRTYLKSTPSHSSLFDWLMIGASTWFWIGIFLDGWAHNHIQNMDTFFSPWHAVFYSGFLATATVLLSPFFLNLSKGNKITSAVPSGYGISLIGLIIFGVAGLMDLGWHTAFGFEQSIDALLSPTHLLLAVGGGFIISGVIRSGLNRPEKQLFIYQLPMIIAVSYLLSLLGDLTQYSNPLVWPYASTTLMDGTNVWRSTFIRQSVGAAGMLLHTAFSISLLLTLLYRNRLLPGAITIIFTINAGLLSFMKDRYEFILPIFLAGILSDMVLMFVRSKNKQFYSFFLFATVVPIIYNSAYMGALFLTSRVWWSVHFWVGSIIACGIIGFLLNLLIVSNRSK